LQSKNKLRKTKNIDKITINKREIKEIKEIEIETKETKIKIKIIETSIEVDAKTNAIVVATIATIVIDEKYLLKLRKQSVCIYISFFFKIVLILLSCLLLFNNL